MRHRITVCKDCPDRVIGCHSNCERYIAEKADHDAEKTQIFRERNKEMAQISIAKAGIKRMKKGKKR